MAGFHLLLRFRVSLPFFAKEQLDAFERVVRAEMPQWAAGARACRPGHRPRAKPAFTPGARLFDLIEQIAPSAHAGIKNAILFNPKREVTLYLDSCDSAAPSVGNGFTAEVFGRPPVEGRPPWEWARSFFEAICGALPLRHTHGELSEEFDAKNMDREGGGCAAVGVNLAKALPGLYWLNFLGPPYLRLMGRVRVLLAPATRFEVGDGVLLSLAEAPFEWSTSPSREREEKVIEHLGQQFFFSRHDLTRQTVAPDFLAEFRVRQAAQAK